MPKQSCSSFIITTKILGLQVALITTQNELDQNLCYTWIATDCRLQY